MAGRQMSQGKEFITAAADTWPFVLVALAGAVVRAGCFGCRSLWQFGVSCLCAAFTAFLAAVLLSETDVGYGVTGALCGVIGYSGGAVLDAALWHVVRRISPDRADTQNNKGELEP